VKAGVILLAAGRSRRFGSDKRNAQLDTGQTLLAASIAAIEDSGLPLLVCLDRPDTDLAATLADRGVNATLCDDADLGMGHTLSHGVDHRPGDWEGILVALADMPWIRPDTYLAIARQLTRDTIVVPCYRGRRGNPVGFGAAFFEQLAATTGDRGARNLLASNPGAVNELALDDPGLLRDVDTVDALRGA
jgi:molybdenum cofactor cytidylyltransferase